MKPSPPLPSPLSGFSEEQDNSSAASSASYKAHLESLCFQLADPGPESLSLLSIQHLCYPVFIYTLNGEDWVVQNEEAAVLYSVKSVH